MGEITESEDGKQFDPNGDLVPPDQDQQRRGGRKKQLSAARGIGGGYPVAEPPPLSPADKKVYDRLNKNGSLPDPAPIEVEDNQGIHTIGARG